MIIVNKYVDGIKAIVVGMETNLSTMEWPHSVTTVTEQQSWLKDKLKNIENMLMKLLEGTLCIFKMIFKCVINLSMVRH